eukprot:PhF_6_TR31817/c1_g1_i2/m.47002/K18283/PDE2A; cGMP-dependent 3',5'-cyclic phosphodiesterase
MFVSPDEINKEVAKYHAAQNKYSSVISDLTLELIRNQPDDPYHFIRSWAGKKCGHVSQPQSPITTFPVDFPVSSKQNNHTTPTTSFAEVPKVQKKAISKQPSDVSKWRNTRGSVARTLQSDIIIQSAVELVESPSVGDIQATIRNIIDNLQRVSNSDRVCVLMVDDDVLTYRTSSYESTSLYRVPVGEGVVGRSVQSLDSVNLDGDILKRELPDPFNDGTAVSCALVVPLIREGEGIGCAILGKLDEGATFSYAEMRNAEIMALFAAIAYANTDQYSQKRKELRTRAYYMDAIYRLHMADSSSWDDVVTCAQAAARTVVDAEIVVYLYAKATHEFIAHYKQDQFVIAAASVPHEAVLSQCYRTRKPILTSSPSEAILLGRGVLEALGEPFQNALTAPVLCNGELYGVIQAINKGKGSAPFTSMDTENLMEICSFVAFSLANVHQTRFLISAANRGYEILKLTTANVSMGQSTSLSYAEDAKMLGKLADIDVSNEERIAVREAKTFNISSYRPGSSSYFKLARFAWDILISYPVFSTTFGIDSDVMFRFIVSAFTTYRHLPFHSFARAFDVIHTLHAWFRAYPTMYAKLSEIEVVSLFIAALFSYSGHPGLNGSFLVQAESPMNVTVSPHDSRGVIETQSCLNALKVLGRPTLSLLSGHPSRSVVQATVCDYLLSTEKISFQKLVHDIRHFAMQQQGNQPPGTTSTPTHSFTSLIIYLSAHTHAFAKPQPISEQWVRLGYEELTINGELPETARFRGSPTTTSPQSLQQLQQQQRDVATIASEQMDYIDSYLMPWYSHAEVVVAELGAVKATLAETREAWFSIRAALSGKGSPVTKNE